MSDMRAGLDARMASTDGVHAVREAAVASATVSGEVVAAAHRGSGRPEGKTTAQKYGNHQFKFT